MISIDYMADYIEKNNQFKDNSDLWKTIQTVMNCSVKQAKQYATTHCNSFSFYCCLFACEFISMTYEEFFMWGKKTGAVNKYGYVDWEKDRILDELCPGVIIKEYTVNNFLHEGVYQVKIVNSHGTHFMFGYFTVKDGLLIYDTSNRGIGVRAKENLHRDDTIVWLKEFVKDEV